LRRTRADPWSIQNDEMRVLLPYTELKFL
jgi:hypothetical protein